jgi:hypothetical protein
MEDEVIAFGVQVRRPVDYAYEGWRQRLSIGDFPNWFSTNASTAIIDGCAAVVDIASSS